MGRKPKKSSKATKSQATKKRMVDEDTKQSRKYKRGGRIEAYTMGEALGSKKWP